MAFKAGAWNAKDDGTTLNLSMSAGTISPTSVTMTKGAFKDYEATITGAPANAKVTFTTDKYRFFLDEVVVSYEEADAPTIAVTTAASGFATYCTVYPLQFPESYGDDDEWKAYTISSVSGDDVTLSPLTGTVKGGVPFILYNGGNGSKTYSLTAAVESSVTPTNLLEGTLAPKIVADDEYYALSGGNFVKVKAGTVPANKALLPAAKVGSGAKLNILFSDETDGISEQHVFSPSDDAWYTLSGQKVVAPAKGVFIHHGKKVIRK